MMRSNHIKKIKISVLLTLITMVFLVFNTKKDIVSAETYDGSLGSVLNVDNGTLSFTNYGGWTGSTIDDRIVANAAGYYNGYKAYFTTTITGPKVLSWDWSKNYSAKSNTTLALYIDDVFQTQLAETNSWVTQIVEIPAGMHVVKWYYQVNQMDTTSPLYNAVYIDNVKLVQPLFTVTFNENHTSNSKITTTPVFTAGSKVSLPTEPTRAGYVFLGWNTKADGSGEVFTSDTNITKTLTVYAQWGLSGSTTLPSVPTTLTVKAEKSAKLVVSNADGAVITYKSANESIATVDENGKVNGVLGGTTTITTKITTTYGKIFEFKTTITVTPTLKISKTSATLYVKKTLQLNITGTNNDIEWISDDTNVASVSSKGVVTGKEKGTVIVYAYVDGEEFSCTITVKAFTNTAKAKNAYLAFLNSTASNKYFTNYFGIVDIDRDGTVELILGDSDPWNKDYYATWQIFTFYNNEVKYIGKIRGEGVGYSESKRTLITCTASSISGTSESVYKKSKNKILLIHNFYDGNYGTKRIDGKKYSSKYFKQIYNKYVANETDQVVFYENDDENRTDYLQ